MASISSKKLLPSTEKRQQVFLVPYTNIVPSTPKLDGVNPIEEKKETAKTSEVNKKLSEVIRFFRYNLLLRERDKRRKLRERGRKRFEESESRLEVRKLGKKRQQEKLAAKIPGSSIFDRLARFTGFTLFGFVFNNFSNLLPGLNFIGSFLKPAAKGIDLFAESIFEGAVEWIDRGYKAYDAVGKIIKDLGGENYERLFNQFSGALNLVINGGLLAGAAGLRGGLFKPETSTGAAEALKKSKSVLSGEAAIARRRKIFDKVSKNKANILARRNARRKARLSFMVRRSQQLQRRKLENRKRIESLKENRKRRETIKKLMQVDPDRANIASKSLGRSPGDIFEGILPPGFVDKKKTAKKLPKKPAKQPQTLRISQVKYAETRGGDYVEFGLPGQPKRRFPPQVAEGIKHMFENPKDRYTKQIAYEAFKNPDLYDVDIRENYKESVKKRFKQSKMKRPERRAAIANVTDARRLGRTSAKSISRGARVVPFIGPLIDIIISILAGDPLDEAVIGTAGATLGGFIGTAIVGAGTFGLGAVIGAGLGSFIGDIIARSLYDAAKQMFSGKKTKGYNQGGIVASRQIKSETKPKGDIKKTISPVGLQPRFSENDLKTLYGDSVGILGKISGIMTSPGGFIGSIMSSSINLLFGQKFDGRLLSYIRQTFGRGVESNVRSSVDTVVRNLELFLAFGKGTGQTEPVLTPYNAKTFIKGPPPGPAPGDALERKPGKTTRPPDLDPSIPMADDVYVYPDGSILKPGMEVGSLQFAPSYSKHMEFTYAIQPVMVG